MNISIFQCYLTLSLTIFLGVCTPANSKKKDKNAIRLCGQDFLTYYKYLCGHSQIRPRRSIWKAAKKEVPKVKLTLPVLQEKLAKQFLRRIRRMPRNLGLNAAEECCNETCNVEEIREYPCH